MFCGNCGHNNNAGAAFCGVCGNRLENGGGARARLFAKGLLNSGRGFISGIIGVCLQFIFMIQTVRGMRNISAAREQYRSASYSVYDAEHPIVSGLVDLFSGGSISAAARAEAIQYLDDRMFLWSVMFILCIAAVGIGLTATVKNKAGSPCNGLYILAAVLSVMFWFILAFFAVEVTDENVLSNLFMWLIFSLPFIIAAVRSKPKRL